MPHHLPVPDSNSASNPYAQGLPPDVATRLATGRWTEADMRMYLRTEHWKATAAQVKLRDRLCRICGRNMTRAVHHPADQYKKLFREVLERLLGVCNPCHRKIS